MLPSFLTPNNRWISRQVPVPLHSTIQLSGREKYFTSSEEACRDSQLTSPPRCINHPPPAWVGTPTSLPYCTSEWYDSGSLSISSPESHSSCLQITDKSLQIQWRAVSKMPQSLELPLPISIQLDALLADSVPPFPAPHRPPSNPGNHHLLNSNFNYHSLTCLHQLEHLQEQSHSRSGRR